MKTIPLEQPIQTFMTFKSKARTLQGLSDQLKESSIPQMDVFRQADWYAEPALILERLSRTYRSRRVVVRSSAASEDAENASMAGAFLSVIDVDGDDPAALSDAIHRVCQAMSPPHPEHLFFVQEMVQHVVMSGVVMTRDLHSGAPYYVINYDDESGRTDTVTGGTRINKTLYVFHEAPKTCIHSARIRSIVAAVQELEYFFRQPLDIEFALDSSGIFHLLQVRPMTTARHWASDIDKEVRDCITSAFRFLETCPSLVGTHLLGGRSLFGSMPDWNPAELIGRTPKAMAVSVFRRFITRGVWREARGYMGYRNPAGQELMVMLAGHPYIDVRASFNSFLPVDLPDDLGHRLVDAWMENLEAQPELHDKVEFEIVQSSIDFSFDRRFEEKTLGRFTAAERQVIRHSLGALTRRALLSQGEGSLPWALSLLEALRSHQMARPLAPHVHQRLSDWEASVRELTEEGVALGALPFAVVARHAFIAEAFLRSILDRGALSEPRVASLRASIQTIASDLARHLERLCGGEDPADFIAVFGHLRPGTFDVESPRYVDRIHQLAGNAFVLPESTRQNPFTLHSDESNALFDLLSEYALQGISPESLIDYIKRAISAREYGKFVLSRSISDVLEHLAAWGDCLGLTRTELASLALEDIEAYTSAMPLSPSSVEGLKPFIEAAEAQHRTARATRLPALIIAPGDTYVAAVQRSLPNLFGEGVVRGSIREISAYDDWSMRIEDEIACIESADPGFDWVFGTGAAALVTKYGGTNSHMAIRCMEIGFPAAIGCGEQLYSRILEAGYAELNFSDSSVKPLHGY